MSGFEFHFYFLISASSFLLRQICEPVMVVHVVRFLPPTREMESLFLDAGFSPPAIVGIWEWTSE